MLKQMRHRSSRFDDAPTALPQQDDGPRRGPLSRCKNIFYVPYINYVYPCGSCVIHEEYGAGRIRAAASRRRSLRGRSRSRARRGPMTQGQAGERWPCGPCGAATDEGSQPTRPLTNISYRDGEAYLCEACRPMHGRLSSSPQQSEHGERDDNGHQADENAKDHVVQRPAPHHVLRGRHAGRELGPPPA